VRERWAQLTNSALHEAGIDARVDHRSYAAQGIDREPQPRFPIGEVKLERRGVRSEISEQIRAQYQKRVQQRLLRAQAKAAGQGASVAADPGGRSTGPAEPAPKADLAEVRRQAREAWLALRATVHSAEAAPREREPAAPERQADDDLTR
jgi:hypothetical protein